MEFAALSGLKAVFPNSVNESDLNDVVRFDLDWDNPAAVTTTTAIAEVPGGKVKRKCRLVRAFFTPNAAVTGTAANFFNLIIRKRTAAAPAVQVPLILFAADTPTTDDIAAWASKDLMGLAAYINAASALDLNFAADDVVTIEVTKAGTGMTFPAGRVTLVFEPRD